MNARLSHFLTLPLSRLALFAAGLLAVILYTIMGGPILAALALWFILDSLIARRSDRCAVNTLGTLSGTEVIQDVLSTLLVDFPILSQISTGLDGFARGAEQLIFNRQVTTRVIVPTVAIEHVALTGYQNADQVAIDVNITINHQAEQTYLVTDREMSSTSRNLREEFVKVQAHALGTKIVSDLFATVTAATFPLFYSSAAAAFDSADVRKIKTMLQKAKVPSANRFMCINSDFAEGLGLDNLIVANPNTSNQGVITTGALPNQIHGFNPSEFATLPDNGEKLAGIAGNKEAIIMATRVPTVAAPANIIPGLITTITEPNTGLSVQLRQWYDMIHAGYYEALTLMYGFAAGLSETGLSRRLVRITTI
jgi:hypothetical protein